jgi:hypothetical protein
VTTNKVEECGVALAGFISGYGKILLLLDESPVLILGAFGVGISAVVDET